MGEEEKEDAGGVYHHCLSALWGPFYYVFLSLSSRGGAGGGGPSLLFNSSPTGRTGTTRMKRLLLFFCSLSLLRGRIRREREEDWKVEKLRAKKFFLHSSSFPPRLLLFLAGLLSARDRNFSPEEYFLF